MKSKCRQESKQTIGGSLLISCTSFRGQSQKEEVGIINMENLRLLCSDSVQRSASPHFVTSTLL